MTETTPLMLEQCALCRALGGGASADLLGNERLPEEVFELDGMSRDLSRDEEQLVLCRRCLTPYTYVCSAGYGEHWVSVTRTTLSGARAALGEANYAFALARLPAALGSTDERQQEFAAASLAHHHLLRGEVEPVLALLRHRSPRVVIHAALQVKVHARSLEPFVADFVALLTDGRPNVRVNVEGAFSPRLAGSRDAIRWGGVALLRAYRDHCVRGDPSEFRLLLQRAAEEGVDVSPYAADLK